MLLYLLPIKPVKQLHTTSFPFKIKHCPPFLQILIPVGQKDTAAVGGVVVAIVVVTNNDVSHKFPKYFIIDYVLNIPFTINIPAKPLGQLQITFTLFIIKHCPPL